MVKLTESGYTVSIMDNLMNSSEKAAKESLVVLFRGLGKTQGAHGDRGPFLQGRYVRPAGWPSIEGPENAL